MSSNIPNQLQEVLEDLRLGRLLVQRRDPGQERALDLLGRRLFTGMLLGTLLACASFLLVYGPSWAATSAAIFASFVLLVHVAVEIYQRLSKRGD